MVTSHTLIKDSIAAIAVAGVFCGAVLIADAYHSVLLTERIIDVVPTTVIAPLRSAGEPPVLITPEASTSDTTVYDTTDTSTTPDELPELALESDDTTSPTLKASSETETEANTTIAPLIQLVLPTQPIVSAASNVTQSALADHTFAAELITLIEQRTNAFRKRQGLDSLTHEPTLERNARRYSQTMLEGNFLAHTDESGCDLTCRFTADNYRAQAWGENLARLEFSDTQTPADVADYFMTEWQKSAGHRTNLLSAVFTHQGVGVVHTDNRIYVTVHFALPL